MTSEGASVERCKCHDDQSTIRRAMAEIMKTLNFDKSRQRPDCPLNFNNFEQEDCINITFWQSLVALHLRFMSAWLNS